MKTRKRSLGSRLRFWTYVQLEGFARALIEKGRTAAVEILHDRDLHRQQANFLPLVAALGDAEQNVVITTLRPSSGYQQYLGRIVAVDQAGWIKFHTVSEYADEQALDLLINAAHISEIRS